MRRIRLAACGLAAAFLLLGAAPAGAADRVLGFDELPDNTVLGDQYPLPQDPGKGPAFGAAPPGVELSGDPRVVTVGAGESRSAPKVVRELGGGELCEAEETSTWARFAFARDRVRVYARIGFGTGTVRLRAYDVSGDVLVDSASAASPAGGGLAPLEVTTNGPQIVYIRIGGDNGCVQHRFDDLTFDDLAGPGGSSGGGPPPPLPPPDFGLVRVSPSDLELSVVTGKSLDIGLGVTRVNQSSGPISYAVSGLPSGVTASFPDGQSTASAAPRIRLTASKNAPITNAKAVTITGTPSAGAGSAPRQVSFKLDVHGRYDLRITGIEVTQGIQDQLTPCTQPIDCLKEPSLPFPPSDLERTVPYRGVRLAARKQTAVRVYANVKAGDSVDGVTAALRAFRGGKQLAGGPLLSSPRKLVRSIFTDFPWVTWAQRTLAGESFDFILPPEWTTGEVSLRASLIGPLSFLGGPAECETQGCEENNGMALAKIPFIPTGFVKMANARLWYSGEDVSDWSYDGKSSDARARLSPDPDEAFELTEQLLPLQEGGLDYNRSSYYATIDITDIKNVDTFLPAGKPRDKFQRSTAKNRLADYADEYPGCAWADFCADSIVGVYGPQIAGGSGSSTGKLARVGPSIYPETYRKLDFAGAIWDGDQPIAVTSYANPVTGLHEVSHGLGRKHADLICGGNSDGQNGETHTLDGRGTIEGVGLDLREWPMRPIAAKSRGAVAKGAPDVLHDYMSYCDPNPWTSVLGWEKNFTLLRKIADTLGRTNVVKGASLAAPVRIGGAPRAGAAQAANLLRVRASVTDARAEIASVKPRSGRPAARPPASSPLVLVARDAAGAERARVPMKISDTSEEGAGDLFGEADVPAAGVASLELLRDGQPVARRAASANRPVVKVLSPRRGRVVGRSRETTVRWRATDRDGDQLLVKVDYSIDGGRSWELIHLGPDNGRASLPSGAFAGSRRARVRVRANDGFHEVAAESARFRAVARKPAVEILAPVAGRRVRADQTVGLQIAARDDRGKAIRGARGCAGTTASGCSAAARRRRSPALRPGAARCGSSSATAAAARRSSGSACG